MRTILGISLILALVSLLNGCAGSSAPLAIAPRGLGLSEVPEQAPPALNGDVLKITSIDGDYTPVHPKQIFVHASAGDVVVLTADIFSAHQSYAPKNVPLDELSWRTTLNEICSGATGTADCLSHSGFQTTQYGVLYYVPFNMPHQIQLIVSSNDPQETSANHDPIYDSVNLVNLDDKSSKWPMLATPLDYSALHLDPNAALVGLGRWMTIQNVRYFLPTTYTLKGEVWAPYQHGYWGWDDGHGWTWVSYDPWGWLTDHYGVWRHHAAYGWMWEPFNDLHYEPHSVAWITSTTYAGWFPYNAQYALGYMQSEVEGFDDGLWLGYRVGVGYGKKGYRFHPGFTSVEIYDIAQADLARWVLGESVETDFVREVFAHNVGRVYFEAPGGYDRVSPQTKAFFGSAVIPKIVLASPHRVGEDSIRFPLPDSSHSAPFSTADYLRALDPLTKPIAIGSVLFDRAYSPRLLPPTVDGRGLAAPPLVRNERGQVLGALPARSTRPLEAPQENALAQTLVGAKFNEVHQSPHLDLTQKPPEPRTPLNPRQIKPKVGVAKLEESKSDPKAQKK